MPAGRRYILGTVCGGAAASRGELRACVRTLQLHLGCCWLGQWLMACAEVPYINMCMPTCSCNNLYLELLRHNLT